MNLKRHGKQLIVNVFTWFFRFLFWALWQQEASRINAWRKDVLGLPPMTQGLGGVLEASGEIPVVQMCSRFMIIGAEGGGWGVYVYQET